jgi:hypothetical protein
MLFKYYRSHQEGRTGPAWEVGSIVGEGRLGKDMGGEFSVNTVYTCMKMEK